MRTYNFDRPVPSWAIVWFRLVLLLAASALAFASLTPAPDVISINHTDKVMHIGAYGLLAAIVLLALPKLSRVWVFWVCTGYGVLLEILQGLSTASRTASALDALANTIGIVIALSLWSLFVYYRAHRKETEQ